MDVGFPKENTNKTTFSITEIVEEQSSESSGDESQDEVIVEKIKRNQNDSDEFENNNSQHSDERENYNNEI